jgi:hypothetical protein
MLQSQDSQSSNYHSPVRSSVFEDSLGPILPSEGSSAGVYDTSSYGQLTPTSTPIVQPSPRSVPIPPNLERVGPTKKDQPFILWTEEMNDDFCEWWLKTEFGARTKRNIFESKRTAECWKHFHQVAAISDGTPKVMCKTCNQLLNHPADGHRGTSSMNKHFSQEVQCKRKAPTQDIRKAMQKGVY